jgi:hypothetical protein
MRDVSSSIGSGPARAQVEQIITASQITNAADKASLYNDERSFNDLPGEVYSTMRV